MSKRALGVGGGSLRIAYCVAAIAGLLAALLPAGQASAQTCTWVGLGENAWWSTAENWDVPAVFGPDCHLVFGAGFDSGSPYNNVTGAQVGSLGLSAPHDLRLYGSDVFLNGPISSSGQGVHLIDNTLRIEAPVVPISVAPGPGYLQLRNIYSAMDPDLTLVKEGAGELLLRGYLGNAGTFSHFVLQGGTVTIGHSYALGYDGDGNHTGRTMQILDGTTLRAAAKPILSGYGDVRPDVTIQGKVTFGDATGQANNDLAFRKAFRLADNTELTIHNTARLYMPITGGFDLTVKGSGKLTLCNSPAAPAEPLGNLIIDGGTVVSQRAEQWPAYGITLTNGGTLETATYSQTVPLDKAITVAGSGVIRTNYRGDLRLNGPDMLRGFGDLRIEGYVPARPPSMPANYYYVPGKVYLNSSNWGFFGNVVIDGADVMIGAMDSLGPALMPGGPMAVVVNSGALAIAANMSPDLSRLQVNPGGALKVEFSRQLTIDHSTVWQMPLAGMLGLNGSTITGLGVPAPVTDGTIVKNLHTSATANVRCDLAYMGPEGGTLTLAGSYLPNKGSAVTWSGALTMWGQINDLQGGEMNLKVSGSGVVMKAPQLYRGMTFVEDGRLDLEHVEGLGLSRIVTVASGSQLDLDAPFMHDNLPLITPDSAGMIGLGSAINNDLLLNPGLFGMCSIGPAYNNDYTLNVPLMPGPGDVYRLGTVTAAGTGPVYLPKALRIPLENALSGPASVVIGAEKGPSLGSAGCTVLMNANQDYYGGTTVLRDWFLGTEQTLERPFGWGTVEVYGKLVLRQNGSLVNVMNPIDLKRGSEVWLDNSQGVLADRWPDYQPLFLNAGALKLYGNSVAAVEETVGPVMFQGRSRMHLERIGTTQSVRLILQGLNRLPEGYGTMEIYRKTGTEQVIVQNPPEMGGMAMIVPAVVNSKDHTFMTRDPATGELMNAMPNMVDGFAGSTRDTYVETNTALALTENAEAYAVRLTGMLSESGGDYSLTVGDGKIGQMICRGGSVEIRPDLTFDGEGLLYVPSGSRAVIRGALTAPEGLTKFGAGDLTIYGGASGGVSTVLRIKEGRLTGTGSIGWTVVVEEGATVAVGSSPGVQTYGGLIMEEGSAWEFELAALSAVSDKIIVLGDLTLNGTVNIVDWDGTMEAGKYDLITWGGSLTNNGLTLGLVPDGFEASLVVNEDSQAVELHLVPEPASMALLSAGALLALRRRRR